MFFFRKLFGLFFFGLLVFGLLGLFGGGRHGRTQSAYRQGFIDGQQAAAVGSEAAAEGAEGASTAVPQQMPGTNVYYRGHGFFLPGFGLLFCLIPFFFIGLFFMVFGRGGRHGHGRHRGPWGHHRGGYGPWGQGPCGPKRSWQEEPKEKSPDDIDDGADEAIRRA